MSKNETDELTIIILVAVIFFFIGIFIAGTLTTNVWIKDGAHQICRMNGYDKAKSWTQSQLPDTMLSELICENVTQPILPIGKVI